MDRILDNIKHANHSLIFRIINIIVACFMIIGGVVTIITGGGRRTLPCASKFPDDVSGQASRSSYEEYIASCSVSWSLSLSFDCQLSSHSTCRTCFHFSVEDYVSELQSNPYSFYRLTRFQ